MTTNPFQANRADTLETERELRAALEGSPFSTVERNMIVELAHHAVGSALMTLVRIVESAPETIKAPLTMAALGFLSVRVNEHIGTIVRGMESS
jgi:hypothetical protein